MTLALIGCAVAFLLGIGLLFARRHETSRPPTKPLRYFLPGRFAPWPLAVDNKPVPIPERSWKWQLGLGLAVYSVLLGGVLLVIKFLTYLASVDQS